MATETKKLEKGVKAVPHEFRAVGKNFRIIRKGEDTSYLPDGRAIRQGNGIIYDFGENGMTTVYEGEHVLDDGPLGEDRLPTEQDGVEFLRGHWRYGITFFELGNAPDMPKPTFDEVATLVTDAAVRLDVEPLREARTQEERTHNRAEVFRLIDNALEQVDAQRAELEAQHAELDAQQKPGD